jgi:hypothetical protein
VLEKTPREQRVHFLRFHFTSRAFRKSMNLEAWDMKMRYRTENYTLECFVRGFRLFLSVSEDPASSLPGDLVSDDYLEFGDATWNFLMRTRLFYSVSSSGRARTLSLHSSFYWGHIRSVEASLNRQIPPLPTSLHFTSFHFISFHLGLTLKERRKEGRKEDRWFLPEVCSLWREPPPLFAG